VNVTLKINDELERSLVARARARGLSLEDYLKELVAREASLSGGPEQQPPRQFDNLSDLLLDSPFAGANLDLGRSRDNPRPVDLG